MIELKDFFGVLGAPLVIALVEATKRVLPECQERWYPLLAFAWAAIINAIIAYTLQIPPATAVLATIVCALSASGLYSQARAAQ